MSNTALAEADEVYMTGWLRKWTNCIRRYQRRWFVLSEGSLCYYRDETRDQRGVIHLRDAHVKTVDSCKFVISWGNTKTWQLKADSQEDRREWIAAMERAKGAPIEKGSVGVSRLSIVEMDDFSKVAETLCTSVVDSGKRRYRVPDRPDHSLGLWSVVKNLVGKDLTKVPLPVNFSEPLSMLQRLTEDFEYAALLDQAAACSDPSRQLAYVAAFTVSCYSGSADRTSKPFNPLLGETFECDRRDDLGWRAISEQVSHHPPVSAYFCEGSKWQCWKDLTMTSKFRGQYLQVTPVGTVHCVMTESGNHYTWRKATTMVYNVIVGKLWINHQGEVEIINHTDGSVCKLKYAPYSFFGRETPKRVTGSVENSSGTARWLIRGTWDHHIDIGKVEDDGTTIEDSYDTIWKINEPPPDNQKYYNFSLLACQLNEMEKNIAPTDSRLRLDQRLMEVGRWDEANQVKQRLEERQRARTREGGHQPLWFRKQKDPRTGQLEYVYQGEYWDAKEKQDWKKCPDIFSGK